MQQVELLLAGFPKNQVLFTVVFSDLNDSAKYTLALAITLLVNFVF